MWRHDRVIDRKEDNQYVPIQFEPDIAFEPEIDDLLSKCFLLFDFFCKDFVAFLSAGNDGVLLLLHPSHLDHVLMHIQEDVSGHLKLKLLSFVLEDRKSHVAFFEAHFEAIE